MTVGCQRIERAAVPAGSLKFAGLVTEGKVSRNRSQAVREKEMCSNQKGG
jgi:hypothetical protein